jgi:hypothetical protein
MKPKITNINPVFMGRGLIIIFSIPHPSSVKYQAQALHVHDRRIEQQEGRRKDNQSAREGQQVTFDIHHVSPFNPHA